MTTYGSSRPDRMFRFGSFELSEREGELRKNGVRIQATGSSLPRIARTVVECRAFGHARRAAAKTVAG